MNRNTPIAVIAVAALMSASPTTTQAQDAPMPRSEKLTQIDRDIAQAEQNVSTGKKLVFVGVLGTVASPVILISTLNYPVFALWSAAATGAWIFGAYKWYDGASQRNSLKAKRYDIAIMPVISPASIGRMQFGVATKITF